MSYLLGIDAGTSMVKAALFNARLQEVAVASRRTHILTPQPGWTEMDMTQVWQQTALAIRAVLNQTEIRSEQIAAVGITGNMVGAWLVDDAGDPVRPAILHTDNRTQPLIQQWEAQHPDFHRTLFEQSHSAMQPGCTLPLVHWLQANEPENLSRAAHILCCKDWLIAKLTGTYQVDPSEASVMPGDVLGRTYSEPLFELFDIEHHRSKFPQVVPSSNVVGTVTQAAAAETGLQVRTPVVAGAGDVLVTGLGAGAVSSSMAYTILGTAGINGLVMDSPKPEPDGIGLTFCQPGGKWVRVMVNTLGTPNLDWCVRELFSELPDDENRFATLETKAQTSRPGANGVHFLPYLSPTGTFAPFVEPNARGIFSGITLEHTRDDLLRAVYEGVSYSIRHCFDAMPEAVNEIRLTGGGANSAFWTKLVADITGRTVVVPEGHEFGARGAALLAGVGIGLFNSIDTAPQVTVRRQHSPETSAKYAKFFESYLRLAEAMRSVWHRAPDSEL